MKYRNDPTAGLVACIPFGGPAEPTPAVAVEILDQAITELRAERDELRTYVADLRSNTERLCAERDELRAVLREIHKEFTKTYDVSDDLDRWTASGSIPVVLMRRAEKLLEGK